MASSFRYVAMFTCDYFYPAYMLMAFPRFKMQFAAYEALCTVVCGLFAAISGGLIAEKIGKRDPRNYSRICSVGAMIAWPCMVTGLLTKNFWVAIACLFGKYAFGENYWSPNL